MDEIAILPLAALPAPRTVLRRRGIWDGEVGGCVALRTALYLGYRRMFAFAGCCTQALCDLRAAEGGILLVGLRT